MTVQRRFALKQPLSAWCNSRRKRALDTVVAGLALVLTAPLMLLSAVAIRATSGGPALFRQRRLGLNAQPFELFKFRTMEMQTTQSGPGVTPAGDARITRVGRWLRKWKLDELPQLVNVFLGQMSLVGPRPDLEEYWRGASEVDRQVLFTKPGITGAASLIFHNEEELLGGIPESELTSFYIRHLLPEKARLDREYAAEATFWSDCSIVIKTMFGILATRSATHQLRNA